MACVAGFCNSGCANGEEISTDKKMINSDKEEGATSLEICKKCKVNLILNSVIAGEDFRFCYTCFRSNLFSKFKFSIASSRMVSPSDNLLIAFSGGQSSRVALQFLHEMQYKSWKNFELSKDRSPHVFGVGVAFIDESSISSPCLDIRKVVDDLKIIVSSLTPPEKMLHCVPIESLYSSSPGSNDGLDKLKEMLDCITDITGKEDMLLQLRSMCLQKVALENGYNKIILGSCTSRIACHVISETVKGRGYSLPADIQYVDARWKVPIMLPLRDCSLRELDILCRLDRLNTIEVGNMSRPGINGLVSSFISLLQGENSSRASTVVRTAGKLNCFSFNELPETIDDDALVRKLKNSDLDRNGTIFAEDFCRVCNCPLEKNSQNCFDDGISSGPFVCCRSCRFQMLPRNPSSLDRFFQIIPGQTDTGCKDMRRCEIQHLLLSCEDDIDD